MPRLRRRDRPPKGEPMSSNPTQGAYLPFPLSMLMHPPQPPPLRDEPPARVRLAMALLHQMQEHAGKRYCMTEQHGGEEFDGNALVAEEFDGNALVAEEFDGNALVAAL